MRKDTRSYFKVWKRSLLGNHTFLTAVLRNGLFDIRSQRELVIAVLQEQSISGGSHLAVESAVVAEHDREELRRKALEARKKLKDARRLANKGLPESELSSQQNQLLIELGSGLLERNVLKNNKAYGHGQGVNSTTKEEAAVFRMSLNALGAYFDR